MDLWIRNQNKTELVKVNNLANLDYRIVFINNGNGRATLGTYKTKERALKVLDEIQNFMLCNKEYGYTSNASINELANCYVYEMPKE